MDKGIQLSEHFWGYEFECRCGCTYGSQEGHVDKDLIYRLERLRRMLDTPIIITSGCRCLPHNNEEGGAKKSAHLRGTAADLKILPWNGEARFRIIAAAVLCQFPGMGISNSFIHLDVDTFLPRPSAWGYG